MANAMRGHQARRLEFEPWRILCSEYGGTGLQSTYFVIESYGQLFSVLRELPALLAAARDADPIPAGAAVPGDVVVPVS
jgi:phenylalanine-4-hydroxylase